MAKFWNGLASEFQMTIIFALLIAACWFAQILNPVLVNSFGTIVTALGALAGGNLVHGGCTRIFGKGDSAKDMMGDS